MKEKVILWTVLSLAPLALTGCSSQLVATPVKLTLADPVDVPHPPRPAELKLSETKWRDCGSYVCMTSAEFKAAVKDKLHIAKWMSRANHLMFYYEKVTSPSNSSTPAK